MAQFTDYAKGDILIHNSIQMEEVEMTLKWETGSKPVHTVQKGFSGMSKGSPFMTISWKAAVPTNGLEYGDAIQDMLNLAEVPVTVYVGTKTLTTTGIATSSSFSHAVDTESKVDYEITAVYADFQ